MAENELVFWGRFPAIGEDGKPTRVTVPSAPVNLANVIRSKAPEIAGIIDVVQWPPLPKAQGGKGPGCDGFEPFDPWDLGTKHQQGSLETQYGNLEEYLAGIGALLAHGIESAPDMVYHQVGGENGGLGTFIPKGASGKLNGRGGMTPSCFRGNTEEIRVKGKFMGYSNPIPPFRPRDPVPAPADDTPFGRQKVYLNCLPPGYTLKDAIEYTIWFFLRTGMTGAPRFDDAKGINVWVQQQIMAHFPQKGVAEYFSGQIGELLWYALDQMKGKTLVADFPLHWLLQRACNNYNAFEFDSGALCDTHPELSAGFVDNPDTDTSPGQQVISNKAIAYRHAICLPMAKFQVYGRDYWPSSVWPNSYGLKPNIDNAILFAKEFAFGPKKREWVDHDVYAYSRNGDGGKFGWSGGMVFASNFNTDYPRQIEHDSPFRPNTRLHDYSGTIPYDIWTDGGSRMGYTLPANRGSRGESCAQWAVADVTYRARSAPMPIKHQFMGDELIDTMEAGDGAMYMPQKIRIAAGKPITLTISADQSGWTTDSDLVVTVIDENDVDILTTTLKFHAGSITEHAVAKKTGWHKIELVGKRMPAAKCKYTIKLTYYGAV